ncbi:MAG: hypothetical protein IPI30_21300 [Saprospiraceae bacterium]|nr:hypothetical protein [Candidatus Vicinibacter affinis]
MALQFSEDNNIAFSNRSMKGLVQTPLLMIAGDGYYQQFMKRHWCIILQ